MAMRACVLSTIWGGVHIFLKGGFVKRGVHENPLKPPGYGPDQRCQMLSTCPNICLMMFHCYPLSVSIYQLIQLLPVQLNVQCENRTDFDKASHVL